MQEEPNTQFPESIGETPVKKIWSKPEVFEITIKAGGHVISDGPFSIGDS